ncbi:hypothetical protein C8F04DRAFT_1272400 [Mycena alexandri]|uniref:Uncharacterized protein n=1 Tax=Mycena alexandri TaxID=1745969 RepID=A0AAD6S7R1_9AGAR|nr:hypothetical protein C8F04DRAFT_1272400 [Mycena alexandri]
MPTGLKRPLPTLETLSVSLRGEAAEGANWFSAALSSCPLLTRLHWDGPSVSAPWSQLTYLSLHPSSPADFLHTLPQLINLVELHLSCPKSGDTSEIFEDSTPPLHPCVIPTVTTLGVYGHQRLITFITLPVLQHLVVAEFGPDNELNNPLDRSNCRLESIEIQNPSVNNRIHNSFDHPAVAPSLQRLTTTSQDLTYFLCFSDVWWQFGFPFELGLYPFRPREGAEGLALLRAVDLSFRLDGVNPGEPLEAIAAFIHSRLPSLTVLELDLGVLTPNQLESRWVPTPQGGFTVTRPTHLRVEYEAWLGSDEGREFRALCNAGSEEGKQLFAVSWDIVNGTIPLCNDENRYSTKCNKAALTRGGFLEPRYGRNSTHTSPGE